MCGPRQNLQGQLTAGNYDGVKLLLEPVQAVDCAEAIGPASARPATLSRPWPCRLLSKTSDCRSTNISIPVCKQSPAWSGLRSGEVLGELRWQEMSPERPVRLFDEACRPKVCAGCYAAQARRAARVTAQLLGLMRPRRQGPA